MGGGPRDPEWFREDFRTLLELLRRGEIHPVVAERLPLTDARRAHELLEAEDFHWLGSQLRSLQLPLFSVLEGGYSDDLPELILAYLKGIAGK